MCIGPNTRTNFRAFLGKVAVGHLFLTQASYPPIIISKKCSANWQIVSTELVLSVNYLLQAVQPIDSDRVNQIMLCHLLEYLII